MKLCCIPDKLSPLFSAGQISLKMHSINLVQICNVKVSGDKESSDQKSPDAVTVQYIQKSLVDFQSRASVVLGSNRLLSHQECLSLCPYISLCDVTVIIYELLYISKWVLQCVCFLFLLMCFTVGEHASS